MANQITIDIGAAANDGTGDPLRTAFNYVNNNFSNVWNTGLPNSNVQFSDNRILTVNTNANLVLAPNGIAKVVSNVSILPNMSNVHSVGSEDRRWNTIYAQYLNISNDITFNNVTVDGNLTVQGNTIQIGNIVTDTKTIQLANTANTASAANGSGITVGASDNIATLLYNSTSNVWTTNIGVSVTGNVTGNYILGNGALLTGLSATYGNANVAAYLPTYTGNLSAGNISASNVFTASTITADEAYINTGTFEGDAGTGDNSMYVGYPTFTSLGTDVVAQFAGNVPGYSQLNFQNASNAVTASSDYIITADNGNDSTHFIDLGMTSSTWDDSEPNTLSGMAPNNGYLYVQDGNLTIGTRNGNTSHTWNFDTTGNVTIPGNVLPAGNNIQSLGSPTQQWGDLYLSNATIYMNSVPISLTSGNVLTVDGADVVTTAANGESSIGNLDISGTVVAISASSSETLINITPSGPVAGWAYLQLPTNDTANTSNTRLHNDAGNIEFGTGDFSTGVNNYTWTLDSTGTLTTPGNITFPNSYVYRGNTFTSPETNGILKNFKWEFSDLSSGADTVTLQWNLLDTTFPQWYLTTNSQGNTYVFDGDAKTLGFLDNSINSGTVTFGAAANNGAGSSNDIELTTVTGNAYVRTGSNSWKFDNTGDLTAPGNIIANNLSATNNDGTGRNIKVGDDTWLGDINVSNTLSLRGQQDGANAYIVFGNASNVALGRAGTGPLTYGGDFSVAGNITGNTAGYAIGYRDIPQVSFTGNATIATTDAGKHYYSTESTNYTLTIANNASQGFQVGAAITVVNQGTGNITIAQGSGVTLYMAGNASSGNRSVATFGMATIMKVATNTWFISGVGVA